MDALEALKTRRSVRAYTADPVSREVIEDIVDCGRLAASARNEQPWEFIVITDPERRRRVAGMTEYGKFIADANACIAVFCRESMYYLEDGCAATQNILVAARAHGLGTCWVAGDKKKYAEDIHAFLKAPATHKLVSLIALGHTEHPGNPPKRTLNEVIHWETF